MTVVEGILLGILQGATEFLPISSSGHLMLAEKLLGCHENLFFNVMLHVGTLFAVVTVMWKSVFKMIFHPFSDMRLGLVALASLPTLIIAAVVEFFVPQYFFNYFLPFGFLITMALLLATPNKQYNRPLYEKPVLPVFLTGIAQGFAVLPGISRSGATLSMLNFFGIKKEQSAEFVFLLSLPVILGGAIVEGYKAFSAPVVTVEILPLLLGVVFAYAVGVISLRFLIGLIKNKSLKPFAFYLLLPFLLSLILL